MALNHTQYSSQLAQYNQRYAKNPFMPKQVPQVQPTQQEFTPPSPANAQSSLHQNNNHNNNAIQFNQHWNDKVTITPKPGQPIKAIQRVSGPHDTVHYPSHHRQPSYKPLEDHLSALMNDNIDHHAIQQEIYNKNPAAKSYKVEVPYLRYEPEYNNSTVQPRTRPLSTANPKANISSFNIIANNEIVPVRPSLKSADFIQQELNDHTRAGARPQSTSGKLRSRDVNTHSLNNPILQQHIPVQAPNNIPVQQPVWVPDENNFNAANNQSSRNIGHHDNWKSSQMRGIFSHEQNVEYETQQRLQHSNSRAYLHTCMSNSNNPCETPHQAAARHKLQASQSSRTLW